MRVTANPQFELCLMGSFSLRRCGQPSGFAINSKKAQALLAYLAMQEPMRSGREHLATLLWPDRIDRMARQNLRSCISSLRRELGAAADELLLTDDGTVGLRDGVTIDAHRLRDFSATDDVAELEEAARLYRGAFLSDLPLESEQLSVWALAERMRLDSAAGAVMAKLASRADQAGDGAKAIEFVSRLVAVDPFREDWRRLSLQLLARHLGRDKALLQARSFVALLKKELDVGLDAETAALVEQIKAGNGGAPRKPTIRPEDENENFLLLSPQHQMAPQWTPASRRDRSRRMLATIAAAAVVVIAWLSIVYAPDMRGRWPLLSFDRAVAGWTIPLLVSPFQSQAAGTAALAGELTEDVLASVSRFSGLTVVDARAVAAEAGGPRFRAWGSVRRQGTVIRVSVGLTDTADHTVVWTDDYVVNDDQAADAIGKVSRRIARAFQVQATYAMARGLDEAKLNVAPLNQLVARALTIQYRSPMPGDEASSDALYDEVLRRDGDNPLALIGIAARLVISNANMLSAQRPALGRAELLVKQALRADPRIERAHYWLGKIYLARGQHELALQSFERALALNPSFFPAEAHAAFALVLSGRADEGLRRIENALAEDSRDPSERVWLVFAAIAQLELGDDAAAIKSLLQAASLATPAPPLRAALASAYALTGDRAKSREQFRLMKQTVDPAALEQLLARAAKSDTRQGSRYLHGLRLAANDSL
jgi:DNA-binding SARP family transcriptional activator/tetratricopeptide (TPR) repeat protein